MQEITWTRYGNERQPTYKATVNGRIYMLQRHCKTRTRTERNPRFICIGRKPRYSHTSTWYKVWVRWGEGEGQSRELAGYAGDLVKAKAAAIRHSALPVDVELTQCHGEF